MGKQLIIKGVDFSANALNPIIWNQIDLSNINNTVYMDGVGAGTLCPVNNTPVSYVKLYCCNDANLRTNHYILVKVKLNQVISTAEDLQTYKISDVFTINTIQEGNNNVQIVPLLNPTQFYSDDYLMIFTVGFENSKLPLSYSSSLVQSDNTYIRKNPNESSYASQIRKVYMKFGYR